MLSIRVGQLQCSMPSEQVKHIDYVDTITTLPFTHAPIEGLINFNGQPLLQINVANALGLEQKEQAGSKRLIVSCVQGSFALRVDEVVELAKAKKTATDKNQPAPRLLRLDDILPWSLKIKKSATTLKNAEHASNIKQQKLTVMLIATGDKIIALPSQNIDHIQEISTLQALNGQSIQGDLLVKVKDHLLPTHSLGQLLGLANVEDESIALIIRAETAWALLVQRVLEIEEVSQVYSSGVNAQGLWYVTQTGEIRELIDANNLLKSSLPTAPRLWYVTKDGRIQELIDANSLLGIKHEPLTITVVEPEKTATALQASERLITDGLRVCCGTGCYLLPLTMATRSMKHLDMSSMTTARFPTANRSNRSGRIPWINATALFFDKHSEMTDSTIVVSLHNGEQILLGVDRVILSQSVSALEKWLAVDLPYPLTLFFDAACYDNQTGQWVLRTIDNIRFASLPWAIKKSLVKAILGWFDRRR